MCHVKHITGSSRFGKGSVQKLLGVSCAHPSPCTAPELGRGNLLVCLCQQAVELKAHSVITLVIIGLLFLLLAGALLCKALAGLTQALLECCSCCASRAGA